MKVLKIDGKNHIFDSKTNDFLNSVPERIKSKSTIVKFQANSTVFRKSEKTEYGYILLDGELLVVNEFVDGNYYAFSTLRPFTYLSDLECLSGQMKNAATVIASKESILLRFDIEDFLYCINSDHRFLLNVARSLSEKIFFTSYERGKNLYKTGRDKVIGYIITHCQLNGISSTNEITIKRTREVIASEIGVSIKTVNRSIYELEKEGMIHLVKGKISISYSQYKELLKVDTK